MTSDAAARCPACAVSPWATPSGSQFFVPAHYPSLQGRTLPPGTWQWTDDTEMACSVVAVLHAHGAIDQDALAALLRGPP